MILILFIGQHISLRVGLFGDGYRFIDIRSDDFYITKDKEVIVGSTIVDFDYEIFSNYVIGIRMPIRYLVCDKFSSSRIQVLNMREYFILFKDTGKVLRYKTQVDFENKLTNLNINNKFSLDYSKFEFVWNKYSKLYANYATHDEKFGIKCKDFPADSLEYKRTK